VRRVAERLDAITFLVRHQKRDNPEFSKAVNDRVEQANGGGAPFRSAKPALKRAWGRVAATKSADRIHIDTLRALEWQRKR